MPTKALNRTKRMRELQLQQDFPCVHSKFEHMWVINSFMLYCLIRQGFFVYSRRYEDSEHEENVEDTANEETEENDIAEVAAPQETPF